MPRIRSILLFLLVLLPSILIVWLSYGGFERMLRSFALERREAIANLSARIVEERFGQLEKLGVALATRVQFRNHVAQKNWSEAIAILKQVPEDFPEIDRVFITDTSGTLMADIPEVASVHGQNFAHRDWYKGASSSGRPYVSEMYLRSAGPQINVVAAAIPIKGPSQEITGFLVMQLPVAAPLEWVSSVDVGEGSVISVVDKNGHVAAQTNRDLTTAMLDKSDFEPVRLALTGQSGVGVFQDPAQDEPQVVAYHQVPRYNWAITIAQPESVAFSQIPRLRLAAFVVYGALLTVNGILVAYLIRSRSIIKIEQNKAKNLLRSIGDGVIAIDVNWQITDWNLAAQKLSGYSEEEAIGKPLKTVFRLINESDRKENYDFITEAFATGAPSHMHESVLLLQKDGKEIPVGDTAAPIIDPNGKIIGITIIFRDTLREKEINLLHSSFAYASHQLRTPVGRAIWAIEALRDRPDLGDMRAGIEQAHGSLLSVRKLVNQIDEVSRLEEGVIFPKRTDLDVVPILLDVKQNFEAAAQAKHIHVTTHLPPELPAKTDDHMLRRIVSEILDNAILYSRPETEVILSASIQDEKLFITVDDSGIGIEESEQAAIFTKFFRGSNFDTAVLIGAGLGLYTAKLYVTLLGGKVWFTSTPGKGTQFSVLLPRL